MNIPESQTARLKLRAHTIADFPAVAALWADPRVTRHIGGRPLSAEETWTKFLRYRGHWVMMGFGFWAIEEKATGLYIGEIGFMDFRREMNPPLEKVPEAGWVLAHGAQGKGYATEALQAALAWLTVPRTVCLIHPDNAASIRVAQKCGYNEIGRALYKDQPAVVWGRGDSFRIRPATPEDIPALRELIDSSVRTLQAQDYSSAQIDLALRYVFGTDRQLIADGTYLIVEAFSADGAKAIAGCGGWSKRQTLYGSDVAAGRNDDLLDPRHDPAKIRAFFVHPAWSRRGVGSMILQACENAATEAGFSRFEMGATLTGEKLFRARGYSTIDRIEVPLADGVSLPVIRMLKDNRQSRT